jgi:hypothetical protein
MYVYIYIYFSLPWCTVRLALLVTSFMHPARVLQLLPRLLETKGRGKMKLRSLSSSITRVFIYHSFHTFKV